MGNGILPLMFRQIMFFLKPVLDIKIQFQALKPGRILAQVKDGTRLFLDPNIGIQAGSANNFYIWNQISML